MTNRALLAVALAAAPVIAFMGGRATSRYATRTVWDSVYTTAQAGRGETAYAQTCARCHGASLGGGDESPALTGGNFLGNWNGLPLSDLQTRIKTTMPSDSVGVYDMKLVTDVMAFLLKANGFPAGGAELSVQTDSLKDILVKTSRP